MNSAQSVLCTLSACSYFRVQKAMRRQWYLMETACSVYVIL